jgi:hypothetical protein
LNDGPRTYDGSEQTLGQTNNNDPGGLMQLDFGEQGVKGNRVVHRSRNIQPSNGTTLQAIDNNGAVIFSFLFNGIVDGSPPIADFDMLGNITRSR